MKLVLGIIILVVLTLGACQKQVDGCQHPLAKNFEPAADQDPNDVCEFYELQATFQHTLNGTDTFFVGQPLLDANGDTFVVNQIAFLGGGMHLIDVATGEEKTSIEEIVLFNQSSTPVNAEDNFFIGQPNLYTYNAAGWVELGVYDSLCFHLGLSSSMVQAKQSSVTESQHPLSNTAITNMYTDSTNTYSTCKVQLTQNSTGRQIVLDIVDYVPLHFAKTISVLDGVDTPIPIQINYTNLFNGLTLNTDTDSMVGLKITQNLPNAFSVY